RNRIRAPKTRMLAEANRPLSRKPTFLGLSAEREAGCPKAAKGVPEIASRFQGTSKLRSAELPELDMFLGNPRSPVNPAGWQPTSAWQICTRTAGDTALWTVADDRPLIGDCLL
ncbi:MAG: hypothetical protein WBP72_08395, partial [Rhodocyclaceae bacterium]